MAKLRKMLTNWGEPALQALIKLIETQSKQTLIQWVLDYSETTLLPIWQSFYPNDSRPQESVFAARQWQAGIIKLPEAKQSILKCHQAARESEEHPCAQAAARAVGQASSTIHSARHCIGIALYGALAVAYFQLGVQANWTQIEQLANKECENQTQALRRIAIENEPNKANITWYC